MLAPSPTQLLASDNVNLKFISLLVQLICAHCYVSKKWIFNAIILIQICALKKRSVYVCFRLIDSLSPVQVQISAVKKPWAEFWDSRIQESSSCPPPSSPAPIQFACNPNQPIETVQLTPAFTTQLMSPTDQILVKLLSLNLLEPASSNWSDETDIIDDCWIHHHCGECREATYIYLYSPSQAHPVESWGRKVSPGTTF